MTNFAFGQPDGGIAQMAYKVDDLEAAMAEYGARLGVGPWFVLGPFVPPVALYRGEPCLFEITIAFAYYGTVQIELLQQHNDAPSTLRDAPIGFHHWGIGVRDFDAALAKHTALTGAPVFTDQVPDGGRFAYFEGGAVLPGYIELIEVHQAREDMFAMIQRASVSWDGADPVRRIG